MLALDRAGERLKASEVADLIDSTVGFVPQVLSPLVRRQWLRSDPGPTGGYSLIVDLAEVSLLSVIEAVEGPTASEICVLDGGRCDHVGICAIHGAWTRARAQLLDELASTSLRDIQQKPPRDFIAP